MPTTSWQTATILDEASDTLFHGNIPATIIEKISMMQVDI
jgi:hypothetical protein